MHEVGRASLDKPANSVHIAFNGGGKVKVDDVCDIAKVHATHDTVLCIDLSLAAGEGGRRKRENEWVSAYVCMCVCFC